MRNAILGLSNKNIKQQNIFSINNHKSMRWVKAKFLHCKINMLNKMLFSHHIKQKRNVKIKAPENILKILNKIWMSALILCVRPH